MKNIENKPPFIFGTVSDVKEGKIMRKIWLLSLFALFAFYANNALAADVGVDDGGQSTNACSEQSCSDFPTMDDASVTGGQNCATSESLCYESRPPSGFIGYNYKTTSCTSCPSGYVMDTVTQTSTDALDCVVTYNTCVKQRCPDECPSETEWTPDDTIPGLIRQCTVTTSSGTGECIEICDEGYYDQKAAYDPNDQDFPVDEWQKLSIKCKPCPANGTCERGSNAPTCNKNYYSYSENKSAANYFLYTCKSCPYYGRVSTLTSGAGATSVNQCYVPNTQHMRDAAGNEFRFESNCYYTGTYTSGGMVSMYPQPIN